MTLGLAIFLIGIALIIAGYVLLGLLVCLVALIPIARERGSRL